MSNRQIVKFANLFGTSYRLAPVVGKKGFSSNVSKLSVLKLSFLYINSNELLKNSLNPTLPNLYFLYEKSLRLTMNSQLPSNK